MRIKLESMIYDLPEDIKRTKDAGDFDALKALLDARIASPRTSPMLRDRLIAERELLPRWARRYPYDRKGALEKMRSRVKDFTEEELDYYEKDGCVDYIWLNGEKRYVSSFSGTLIKMNPPLKARQLDAEEDDGIDYNAFIAEIKRKGSVAYAYKIKSSLRIEDEFFEPGRTYTVHIPVAAASAQQSAKDIKITADADAIVSAPDAFQRSVCYKRRLDKNLPFETEIEFTSRLYYVDPFNDEAHIVYPDCTPPCADDLNEQAPHFCFTPYLRALADYIAGEETRPLYLAKRVYDYITKNVRYSFMRSYALIEKQAEYCAINMKGDCGIQAGLFITLCRILGIPARWQSGLTVDPKSTGDHDWAQFWTKEFGWLFADPSYGGGAERVGNEEKRNYYFGNLDPFRMVANRRYQTDFEPAKKFERFDPYDSQDGEVETEEKGFDSNAYDKTDVTLKFEKLD